MKATKNSNQAPVNQEEVPPMSKSKSEQKTKTEKTTKKKNTKKTAAPKTKKKQTSNKKEAPKKKADLQFPDPLNEKESNYVVNLSQIVLPEKWNRKSPGNLASLVTSIKAVGQIVALVVRKHPTAKDKYILIDGRRRYMALQELGVKQAHITLAEGDDTQSYVRSGVANIVREAHNPMEMARMYEEVRENGISNRDIAQIYGKSQGHVSQHLALLHLDTTVQKAIEKAQITMSQARVLCKVNAEEHSAFFYKLFDQMIDKGLDAQTADDKTITYLDRYEEKQREKEAKRKAKEKDSSDRKDTTKKTSSKSSKTDTPSKGTKKRGRPEKSVPVAYDDAKIKPASKTELKGYLAGVAERLSRATSDKTKIALKGELRGIERCAGLRE